MVNKQHTFCSHACRYAFRRSGQWTPPNKFSERELLENIRTLAARLERMPTPGDLTVPSYLPYARRWHSWKAVLQAAGMPESEFLLNDLRRVSALLGHTPTDQEMRAQGLYSTQRYWSAFGSWNRACRLAGLRPHTTHEGGPQRVPAYWYDRKNGSQIRLRGSYELRFASVLDALNLNWLAHGDFDPLVYHDPSGTLHRYMPDFYIQDWDLYIETKGWYQEKDRIKMALVTQEHPQISILIVSKDALAYFEQHHQLPML